MSKSATGCMLVFCAVAYTLATAVEAQEALTTDSSDELVQLVLGRARPVWKFEGARELTPENESYREATLIYQPFHSSSKFCRTYATEIRSPGWVCQEGDCPVPRTEPYEIRTKAYLALASVELDCTTLDFERRYFALERDLHDRAVGDALKLLEKAFREWKQSPQTVSRACDLHQLSVEDLIAIDSVSRAPDSMVRFVLRHPCRADGRVVFDVAESARSPVPYEVFVEVP